MIFPNQSGSRPGDSCVNQWIAITHKIYKLFDDGLEVRGVSLDIFLNGISGDQLKLLCDFLYCHKQQVISLFILGKWQRRAPQGSILRPLLFLIYINDLSNGVSSKWKWKYLTDHMSIFSVVNDIQSSPATLRNDVKVISNWAFQWKMVFNFDLIKQAHQVNLVEPALPVSFV